jgi:hypothetical protein
MKRAISKRAILEIIGSIILLMELYFLFVIFFLI